ncbi:hypothetical protein CPB83DRAFT_647200 [Crepidotus variabilis]|uniref:Uncharacterized protein n=1 Tax=Crepidotus variabilis TaxID=179855 RepID=A0A9P6E7G3_9AGAR|nr:hypothetical protein CPB83DRAFT_647200 [Crepidotus variabilis]
MWNHQGTFCQLYRRKLLVLKDHIRRIGVARSVGLLQFFLQSGSWLSMYICVIVSLRTRLPAFCNDEEMKTSSSFEPIKSTCRRIGSITNKFHYHKAEGSINPW